ncbi:hypothetical protein Pfo_030890 [Paulownia fortunei]|nr:hypothetical protein Pfo_030890 [Paulownia fortunei]
MARADINQLAKLAQTNLDLALGRGGDQVVVRLRIRQHVFMVVATNPMEKRTRVRARMADNIMIAGHAMPDLDSVGAGLGVWRLAQTKNKPAFIVIDEKAIDHANTNISGAPQFIARLGNRVVVIDHHRLAEQGLKDKPLMSYIEPYASSTSELVVELLQYQDQSNAPITKIEATAMLGGIQIDTKNFTLRTGSHSNLIQSFMKEKFTDFKARTHLINLAEIQDGNAIVTEDVKGRGKKGEVKEVPDGYANNFLIKNKKAEPATGKNLGAVKGRQKAEKKLCGRISRSTKVSSVLRGREDSR